MKFYSKFGTSLSVKCHLLMFYLIGGDFIVSEKDVKDLKIEKGRTYYINMIEVLTTEKTYYNPMFCEDEIYRTKWIKVLVNDISIHEDGSAMVFFHMVTKTPFQRFMYYFLSLLK